jgi:hypothetical protein
MQADWQSRSGASHGSSDSTQQQSAQTFAGSCNRNPGLFLLLILANFFDGNPRPHQKKTPSSATVFGGQVNEIFLVL